MRFIFLLVLISAVAAAPVKRHAFFLLLQLFPFASESAPAATATKYPTPPGALLAVGGAVRGVESALPAAGGTLPAVGGSLEDGLFGGLVGPQGRDLMGGDTVEERANPDVRSGEGTTPSSGSVIKSMTIPFMNPTNGFVKPTGTYYPFATAGVAWKRQYDAGNSGEYGAGSGYDGGAGVGNPYAAFDEWKAGRQRSPYGDAGGGDGGAGWDNDDPYARRGLPRDAPSAAYDAGAGAAYNADAGAGYDYGSHAGYAAGAGADADGYTYVKASGSISGSYEAMMAGGGAMDGYGRAGMGAGMGSHAEADMNGRLWPHGTSHASPAYDASAPTIPAQPTDAPSADHVPIPYATAAPDAAVPTFHGPGPMISGEQPSYLADHGLNAYNLPEGPATDIPLQSYTPTDEPQDTAYPEPTYTANVVGEVPVNSPATYDYPAAAHPTEWSYPSVDASDGLPVYSTPATDSYPSEAQPSVWIYPSVNEGSDYGAADAPTPTYAPTPTFDPTLYTMMPPPHGLGTRPWGPGPAQEAKPTMEVEPTYAVQAAPSEAASLIYK